MPKICALSHDLLNDALVLLYLIEEASIKIGLFTIANKTEFMAFNQAYSGSIKSNQRQIKMSKLNLFRIYLPQQWHCFNETIYQDCIAKMVSSKQAWQNLEISPNLKRNFFRATVKSVLLYRATSWTLTSSRKNAQRLIHENAQGSTDHFMERTPNKETALMDNLTWLAKSNTEGHTTLANIKSWFQDPWQTSKTYPDQLNEDLVCLKQNLLALMRDWTPWKDQAIECWARST